MAHLIPSCPNISKRVCSEWSYRYTTSMKHGGRVGLIDCGGNWKDAGVLRWRKRGMMVQCCSSTSSTSSAEEVSGLMEGNRNKGLFGYLVSEYGWNVRRLVEDEEDEIRKAVHVQAEAFYVPLALFNDLFFQFFQAEVYSGLLYKLRNSPRDRYACLVVEPTNDASESQKELVGVVDVTVLRDDSVLQHLQGAEEYLYVSGIAVLKNFRRQKVATVLLKACDMLSNLWGFQYLVLRAYEDDWGARKLYANAGYRVVSGDPPWITTWIGRKRRVLLVNGNVSKLDVFTQIDWALTELLEQKKTTTGSIAA